MRCLPAPQISAEVSYRASISRVQDANLKGRLEAIVNEVIAASDLLALAAATHEVTNIPTARAVGGVPRSELQKVYENRFAKLRSPGRVYYDRLVTSAPNNKCPLCAHRDVTTLDHFLPKTDYPALVVAPLNLIPACHECNHIKLAIVAATEAQVTLHPYFDDVELDEWLTAEVEQTDPPAVRFRVEPPAHWDGLLADRVTHHFDFFRLADLYSAQAADELRSIQFYLESLLSAGGQPVVTAYLASRAASCAQAHLNSWRTATYRAFATSAWFCGGGFS